MAAPVASTLCLHGILKNAKGEERAYWYPIDLTLAAAQRIDLKLDTDATFYIQSMSMTFLSFTQNTTTDHRRKIDIVNEYGVSVFREPIELGHLAWSNAGLPQVQTFLPAEIVVSGGRTAPAVILSANP